MSKRQALQEFQSELHISHSQIFTYLNCSLKYRFQYVEHRPPERISIALPFGSAIHSAIEMYYRSLKNKGHAEHLKALIGRFEDCLSLDLDNIDVPFIFKKDMPERAGAVAMGRAILNAFYECVDLSSLEIVDVELPLSATLYTDERKPTDFKLIGVIDLLRKLKQPKVEHVWTSRTAPDRKRFAKISNAVLAAIDARIFMPQPSWMCGDCAYSNACKSW